VLTLLTDAIRRWRTPPVPDVAAAGRAALAEAERLWSLDLYDPQYGDHTFDGDRCRGIIDHMIRSDEGVGWSWRDPYEADGYGDEWCGITAAYCWRRSIPLATRYTFFASTTRLLAWGQGQPWGKVRNAKPPGRLCVAFDEHSRGMPPDFAPQAGDILLVGGIPGGKRKREGQHVAMVARYDAGLGLFWTVEGNSYGQGPTGEREGVVKTTRPLGLREGQKPSKYHVRWLIRPAPGDLVA
jgi:hypothetical protein